MWLRVSARVPRETKYNSVLQRLGHNALNDWIAKKITATASKKGHNGWPAPKEPEFDFVFASGIFYLLRESPYDHIKMVARMLAHARLGVAFNTLSQKAPTKDKDEFYADPVRILSVAFP